MICRLSIVGALAGAISVFWLLEVSSVWGFFLFFFGFSGCSCCFGLACFGWLRGRSFFGVFQVFVFWILVQVMVGILTPFLSLVFFPFGPLAFSVLGPFNLCNSFLKINKSLA